MSEYVVTSEDLKSFGRFLRAYADDFLEPQYHFIEWFEETPMATRMKGPTEKKSDSPAFPNTTQIVPAPVYYQGFHYSVFEKFFLQAVRELVLPEGKSISRSEFQGAVISNRRQIIKRMKELIAAAAVQRRAEIAAERESSGDEVGGGKRRRRSKRVSRKNRRKTKKNYTSKRRSKRRSNRRSKRRR